MNAVKLNARASIDFDAKLTQTIALLKQAAQDYAHVPAGEAPLISQASSLGAEDMVISHLINSLALDIGIFVLETGRLHKETLAPSLAAADAVYLFAPPDLGWDASAVARQIGPKAATEPSVDSLLARLAADVRAGDHVLIMSNGGFGGLHGRLLAALSPADAALLRCALVQLRAACDEP